MASSTSCAGSTDSLSGASTGRPELQSARARRMPLSRPASSFTNSFVSTDHSRAQPSAWELEVDNMAGPGCVGHGVPGVRPSGGRGRISIWVTERAPWRIEVPTQSDPVSPPPMTTTSLPVARMSVPGGMASPATRRLD